MKKSEMPEITYKVLVSISVFETLQSTEALYGTIHLTRGHVVSFFGREP